MPGSVRPRTGAQRWFQFAGFQFTPSEFAKIALILMLAAMLSELRTPEPMLPDVLRVCIVSAVPMVLVFIQPDIGTTIVLVAIVVGHPRGRRHAPAAPPGALALAAIVLVALAFQLGVIKDYQIAPAHGVPRSAELRGRHELQPRAGRDRDRQRAGCSAAATSTGVQTNLDFVPEQHTDFIFTVVGEEFGFVGAAFVLMLFAILIWRAIRISYLSKDPFGTYVAAGMASMFAIQMFVNVGMVARDHADHGDPVAVRELRRIGRCSRTSSRPGCC